MKLFILAILFLGLSNVLAMEQKNSEVFFPEAGKHYTILELLQKYGKATCAYDDDSKFFDLDNHSTIFAKYRNIIIKKKLGNKVLEFVQVHPGHDSSQPIIRYSKAVTFRLSTICDNSATHDQLIEAEGQIPYNYREYLYIRLGNRIPPVHFNEDEIPSTKEQRTGLNDFLKRLEMKIEGNDDK